MPEETWLCDYVFIVKDLLTPQQCQQYIEMAEDFGFEEALVSSPQGMVRREDVRNNERVVFRNEQIAQSLWELAADFVPHEFEGRAAVGVNDMLRFYRYDVDQQFNWHQDFPIQLDDGQTSFLTFMVYLNDDFEGGETSFEDSYSEESFDEFSVTPKQGMGLFFEHATHHKGEPVTKGRKYVLRTDVMYAAEDEEDHGYEMDDAVDDEDW